MAGAGIAWKLLGTGGAVVTGVVARKATVSGWKLATGKQPPVNPEAPGVSAGEAVAFAAASGVVVALARMLVLKRTAEFWKKSTGKLPPNLNKTAA